MSHGAEHTDTPLLRVREKLGYSLGDFASDLFFMLFIYFGLYYYTDVFGIPAAAVGTMFLVTKLWDTVNDPMMGLIADRTQTRWGKFRPYLLWIVVPFGVLGVLTFSSPNFSITGKIVYAYITYTLMMMAYTAINIPYSALMGVMTPNSKDRTSLSSYRFTAAFAGGIFVSGMTVPLVTYFGGDSHDIVRVSMEGDNTLRIEEKGIGATEVTVNFHALIDEEARKKAGWVLQFQDWFEDIQHVHKTTHIWVKGKKELLDQLFYDPQTRKKAVGALFDQDPERMRRAVAAAVGAPSLAPEKDPVVRAAQQADRQRLIDAVANAAIADKAFIDLTMEGEFLFFRRIRRKDSRPAVPVRRSRGCRGRRRNPTDRLESSAGIGAGRRRATGLSAHHHGVRRHCHPSSSSRSFRRKSASIPPKSNRPRFDRISRTFSRIGRGSWSA